MNANGNSPLDSMRTLEHYLSDIMRAGAADTPEHLKGKPMKIIILIFLNEIREIKLKIGQKPIRNYFLSKNVNCKMFNFLLTINRLSH